MNHITTIDRVVENDSGHSVRVLIRNKVAAVEIGTDTGHIQIPFTNPNDLRAIAGHISAVADELQRKLQE